MNCIQGCLIREMIFYLCLALVLTLSGCSMLGSPAGTPTLAPEYVQATVDAVVTLTIAAMPTNPLTSPTPTKLASLVPVRTPTPLTATATSTLPLPTSTPTATPICDRAVAGSPIDVSIPDDTTMRPGPTFTKIWRLQNAGVCTWTKAYSARFFYGAQMNSPDQVSLISEVLPGNSVEIAVDMVAPATPGAYQGNWKLANDKGQFFGIGPNGDSPFWVRIQVAPAQTTATPSVTVTSTFAPLATSTPTLTPTPLVQASGTVKLGVNSDLDLDSGAITPASGADLGYRKDAGGFHNLVPLNGAELGVYGNSEPLPAACQAAAMSTAPITLESLSAGVYLCSHSDAGHFGWVRYNGLNNSDESANLDFRTWAAP